MKEEYGNSTPVVAVNDEISLKELISKIGKGFRYLITKWYILGIVGFIGCVSGYLYAWSKKPIYKATTTFVLEDGRNSGSQYSGLAALAGISMGGAGGGLFMGDNLLELYKSRTMLQKTLLSYGLFDGKKDLLINRYIKINKLRESWVKNKKLKNLNFQIPYNQYTRAHDSIMTAIIGNINKSYLTVSKPDKKLGIIDVDVKSPDEQFSKNFNDRVVENVNQFYIETKTKKQLSNIRILQRQADSVRAVLNVSIGGTASALDANPNANPALQILRVPSQRRQIDVQSNSAIYAEIVKNLEMAKLTARQDAPLIQVVDVPLYPLSVQRSSKLVWMIMLSVTFMFIASAIMILVEFSLKEKHN